MNITTTPRVGAMGAGQAADAAPVAELPPPTCSAAVVPAEGYQPARAIWTAYSAEDMRAFRAAGVAAERERWAAPVQALLDAHDAGLARVGEQMMAQGLTTIFIGPESQAELEAIAVLRVPREA